MIEARRWLEPRLREMPSSLRRRVEAALEAHLPPHSASPAEALRMVADVLLDEAKRADEGKGHDVALTLLAADALVTYACEMTADVMPERLGDMR